jgi:hypothetical protein
MIDIAREIESTQREVGEDRTADGATVRTVRLQRDLDAPIEDVWDAFTSPERIGRWFLPISGDYRVGGHYQFEGNAGGGACRRRRLFRRGLHGNIGAAGRQAGDQDQPPGISVHDAASSVPVCLIA